MKRLVFHIAMAFTILVGCAQQPVTHNFVYGLPETTQKTRPVTIALVDPFNANPTAFTNAPYTYQVGRAFVNSMSADLEKMLVAKGFKVTGPYENRNIMTFPDKKNANLMLTPIVGVTVVEQVTRRTVTGSTSSPHEVEGVCVVSGWISLVMLEPLTEEKIWIKKIEVGSIKEPFVWKYELVRSRGQNVPRMIEDTRGDAVGAALSKIYPEVMQKMWDYLRPDEVMHAKRQAAEARRLKRY